MHVHVCRQLRLTAEERFRLVAHEAAWKQGCEAVGTHLRAALAPLSALLQPDDIPSALISHVNAIAQSAEPAHARHPHAPPTQPHRSICMRHMHAHGSAPGVSAGAHARNAEHGEPMHAPLHHSTGVRLYATHCVRCGGTRSALGWPGAARLLGASGSESASAERCFQHLVDAHVALSRLRSDTALRNLEPGAVLPPLKIARVLSAHVFSGEGCSIADMMQLCRLVSSQKWWHDVFAVPEALLPGGGCLPRGAVREDAAMRGACHRRRERR